MATNSSYPPFFRSSREPQRLQKSKAFSGIHHRERSKALHHISSVRRSSEQDGRPDFASVSPGLTTLSILSVSPLFLHAVPHSCPLDPPLLSRMVLKLYVDRMSQPSRAIIIFCKMNRIDFEEVRIDLLKGEHRSPEFAKINPMKQVPAIVDGRFKLSESHAILRYLACSFPSVSDHWYPNDLTSRAKVDSILDWHHANLRRGSMTYVFNSALAPLFGLPSNVQVAEEGKKLLISSLAKIESVWLKGDSRFLLGNSQPSIADLSLVCELMQLELIDNEERAGILEQHQKIRDWIENVKRATHPHFLEVNGVLYKVKALVERRRNKASSKL